MRLPFLKPTLSHALVLVAVASLSTPACAGFMLTPGSGSVLPGDAFDLTLRYEDTAPLDFGFLFDLSSSALGQLRLDSVNLAAGSPVDSGLGGLDIGTPLAAALSASVRVSGLLNPAVLVADWSAGVDLLTLSFTLDAGAAPGALTVMAGNGLATIDFLDDVDWSASTSLRVTAPVQPVPEGGSLVSALIALAALGWVRRRA